MNYNAILIVSFGGPEGMDDVLPFLENVLRGRNVPRERMLEVAHHYERFGGVSPINSQVRELISALRAELDVHGIHLPIYWGNRNWHPLLTDTVREMADAEVHHALAFVVAAYSSYSSCRQYRENIAAAQANVGEKAPHIDKIRAFYNHPRFIAASAARLRAALDEFPEKRRENASVLFTAHSIPVSMASQCDYEKQLRETCRLTAESLSIAPDRWQLVYQSRSGRPEDPWLGPDVCDHLRTLHQAGTQDVVIMPVGFLSDHIEVLYDLDVEAKAVCDELHLNMIRAATVGTHPEFVSMIRELIEERLNGCKKLALGNLGPSHDVCPVDCCPTPVRPKK